MMNSEAKYTHNNHGETKVNQQPNTIKTIIFIDSTIKDYQSLIQGIEPSIEVIILTPADNGVLRITDVINKYIHISL